MIWENILAALGLLLVFEGMLPFISPQRFRKVMLHLAAQQGKLIQIIGLISMLIGLAILILLHHYKNGL